MEEISVLIAQAQAGDNGAREVLIEKNLGLVHHIVKRFSGRGYDMEDLFQIKRFLRDDGLVKVSRTLKENGWKIKQASEKLAHSFGRDATLEEISKETGIAREDIVMAMEANVEVESIYKTIYQSDGNEVQLLDKVAAGSGQTGCVDEEKEKLLDHMLLNQLLDSLTDTERELIEMRYFQDKTQTEVAGVMGISQVQVSRLEKKILLRMREQLVC